jgi:adhesin transport system membrane fusion protein
MWPEAGEDDNAGRRARVARLETFHRRHGWLTAVLLLAAAAFVAWSMHFRIDEVARARGEVIASSRVQVIQAVDGGVISQLLVREGDRVERGQVLARLDPTRVGASVGETRARLFGLEVKAARLRAEVTGAATPDFPPAPGASLQQQITVERALFLQRRTGLAEEVRTLQVALDLARQKLRLVEQLRTSGDASGSEVLAARTASNDAEARLVNRRNRFLEEARVELARAEDEASQSRQVLARREQELEDAVFVANVAGIVKNIRVTTVGGVLRAGEEIMQIVPVDDALIIEAKIVPTDISRVHTGLGATIRFDPFDYTIFGSVGARVTYVSADTIKDRTARGEDIYYLVHVVPTLHPVVSTTGRTLEILPGMTAQIDIRTGERTLMDYLLKPLRKTLAESFGER